MSLSGVSDVITNPRLEALKEKHSALSKEIEKAQTELSTTDYYLNQLKKQKLVIKEKMEEEKREAV